MTYVFTTLISIILVFTELSFLPYFKIFGVGISIFLPFIILLSIRVRWYYTFWLAFFGGLIFDYSSGSNLGLFVAIFVFMAMISRALFFKKTNYLSLASYIWLITFGTVLTFILQAFWLYKSGFTDWGQFFLILVIKIILSVIAGLLLYKIFDKFLEWVNKKQEERYR